MTEGKERASRPKLGPQDWIQTALDGIVEEGPTAFRVTRLARRLGVTPASFYWHFEDRDELRDRVLRHWTEQMLRPAAASARTTSPGNLRGLVRVLEKRGLPRVDAAMRSWAVEDPIVAEAVTRADLLRHRVVTRAFESEGTDTERAERRADVLMWAFRGSDGVPADRRGRSLRELLDALLHDAD
ncbi:MAG: TetR/AcrR family transcriptional regulator [Myxococcota bacterium]